MNRVKQAMLQKWANLGPRYMPFADVATADLPLRRLLRLSLFQVSVGMALVLLVGTLNRVMIVELEVPASLVGIMLALPLIFAPFRAVIGHKSDVHRCALGWRRVPFIWNGTLMQFGGLAIMPFAILVLARQGESVNAPLWLGYLAAGAAFLLTGAGVHIVQTAGLALATDLTPRKSHSKVVGLMYVSLLIGMMGSALIFGHLLSDFSPGRLVQVIQGGALSIVVLNVIAVWKQETRQRSRGSHLPHAPDPTFAESWAAFCRGSYARQRLFIVGIGTLGFGMAEILLEPYGGQILQMSVSTTTKLTAVLALGGLMGFTYASYAINKGKDPFQMAHNGAALGIPAFAMVIMAAPLELPALYIMGNLLIGFGGALFGHGTLTATMHANNDDNTGLALGSWGAVQATAAGIGIAISGVIRDLVNNFATQTNGFWGVSSQANGYLAVYLLEVVLLVITVAACLPLLKRRLQSQKSTQPADDSSVTFGSH